MGWDTLDHPALTWQKAVTRGNRAAAMLCSSKEVQSCGQIRSHQNLHHHVCPLPTAPLPTTVPEPSPRAAQGRISQHPLPSTRVLPTGSPPEDQGLPPPPAVPGILWVHARPHLQAAVHQAHDEVKLLVIQHRPVLLHVQVQLLSEAAAGCRSLQGPQHSREQLGTVEHRAEGLSLHGDHWGPFTMPSGAGVSMGTALHRAKEDRMPLGLESRLKLSRPGVPRRWASGLHTQTRVETN